MKYSLRKKLMAVFLVIMTMTLVIIGLINLFFVDDFYLMDKSKAIVDCFKNVESLGDNIDYDDLNLYCQNNNLIYIITNNELDEVQSNVRNEDQMVTQLFGLIMDKEGDNVTIMSGGDNYQIARFHDEKRDTDYIQLAGVLANGGYIILRSPLESISISAGISMRFFLIVGVAAIAVSAIVISFVAKRLTRRVVELTAISESMAELDFTAKYTSGGSDEIGKLGENFNKMSESLEMSMTELKNANIRLEKDVEEKTLIDERRREFLSNVSHELKTPIALIQGYAEGLKEMELDKESRDMYLDVITDEAIKMNKLVMQLMNLEQIESGKDSIDIQCFNLVDVINGVLSASAIMLEQSGAKVIFNPPSKVMVWADEFKTEQVVTNYLTNAIHHLGGEKVIEIKCEIKDGIVTTTVFNTGEPIPEDSLDMLWNKFYKVDKARTRSYGGTGIGLSIVKAIMDAHGQKCSVKNYENGVAFSFTLEANSAKDTKNTECR